MSTKFIIFTFLSLVNQFAFASDNYKPLFGYQSNTVSSRTLSGDYKKSAESKHIASAIKNWEEFLGNYSYDTPHDVEDLTHLVLVRQAHFELARLYYLEKRIKEADALIIKASEYSVYSNPELNNGVSWCKLQGYCNQ